MWVIKRILTTNNVDSKSHQVSLYISVTNRVIHSEKTKEDLGREYRGLYQPSSHKLLPLSECIVT